MGIEWTPDIAVGIEELDRQHQEMFRSLNKLVEAMRVARGRTEVQATLSFLRQYIKSHFALEKLWMERTAYPRMAEHLAQHNEFMGEVERWARLLDSAGASTGLVIETCTTLSGYLRTHIAQTDKAMAAHFKAVGAALA